MPDWDLQSSEKSVRFPGTEVTDSCEPLTVYMLENELRFSARARHAHNH